MIIMAVITAKAFEFNEPVLLVGPTGCGKTTVCQILSKIYKKNLRILNCHMHTEAADFLGSLRPYRGEKNKESSEKHRFFEWSDGPLILSMQEGNFFMADEISLSEDSVLERLNSVLEPERTLLLSEKGGFNNTEINIIKAHHDFKFLATMNPGGDFGKKELSPALRNRFTEIWCKPPENREDLINIAANALQEIVSKKKSVKYVEQVSTLLIDVICFMSEEIDTFKFSIRDILSWCNFFLVNKHLPFPIVSILGFETIFLDSLEMIVFDVTDEIDLLKNKILNYAIKKANLISNTSFSLEELNSLKLNSIKCEENLFGIYPFYISKNESTTDNNDFLFGAPTTKQNLFRLLSAMSLKKAILLEGPPGVGKTSIVESLAKAVGFKIVRINLCEHTDLSDLFGTDLPAEDTDLDANNTGSFVWKDGPLLAALKSENTWILLDELNLAPQNVLEGLNAVLDHRREVYIPELNKTFVVGGENRIFACQNPLRQGGGRKGLPLSFLNRFTKVFLKKLSDGDLLFVLKDLYTEFFAKVKDTFSISLAEQMVKFSGLLATGISNLEFGYKGGPFEINLRDILRWCDSLTHPDTGFIFEVESNNLEKFYGVLFDRMKLIYYQRMRSAKDKEYILRSFSNVFNVDSEQLNKNCEDIGMFWTNTKIYLNDIVIEKRNEAIDSLRTSENIPLLLSSQKEFIKNIAECVYLGKPVLLVGSSDSGKTKLIDSYCFLSGQICNNDIIDDSVTGTFQQVNIFLFLILNIIFLFINTIIIGSALTEF